MDRIEIAQIAGNKLRSERGKSKGLRKQVDDLEERNKKLNSELQRKAAKNKVPSEWPRCCDSRTGCRLNQICSANGTTALRK